MHTTTVSFYFSASNFTFFEAKIWELFKRSNTKAVGDYLREDGPFRGKNGYYEPDDQQQSKVWTNNFHVNHLL
jgi:hypothetical protein